MLIEDWFKFNFPMNDKHRIGTLKCIADISARELRELSGSVGLRLGTESFAFTR